MARQEQGRVGAAVAKQGQQGRPPDSKAPDTRSPVERLRASADWFAKVVPGHTDPAQFIALCEGELRRDKTGRLEEAAWASPETFMAAASECARLGLVPGDTYNLVPFWSNKEKHYEVTGIIHYTGHIDMIYRAGGVASVHCDVVRAADTFIWRPGMELPHHVIHAPSGEAEELAKLRAERPELIEAMRNQEGLADDAERGPLTGVYAYARMMTGGYSKIIVMSKGTVMKHRASSKAGEAFWGPDWPLEGPWTPDMWLKTGLHKLYDVVPHSAEYLRERLRAMAVPELPGAAPAAAIRQAGMGLVAIEGTSGPRPPQPDLAAGKAPAPPAVRESLGRVQAIFAAHGIEDAAVQLGALNAIWRGGNYQPPAKPGNASAAEAAYAAGELARLCDEEEASDGDVPDMLRRLATGEAQ